MTITQILITISPYKPTMTRETLYTHLRALRIKPQSRIRQRPQLYPDNTPQLILKRLGFTPAKTTKRNSRHLAV